MTDKVVFVTGASSGIGRAVAARLASDGLRVVAAARRTDRLTDLAEQHPTVEPCPLDVTDRDAVRAAVDDTVARHGRLDVFIANAGVMPLSRLDAGLVDEWDRMIDVNLKGVLYGIAAVLPQMQKQKSSQFINVSSVAGHRVGPGGSVYAGTKWAVRAISEGLRQEVKPYNIRTTIVSPGAVATE